LEQTGVYSNPSLEALSQLKADVVCEYPLRIKRYSGIVRGKDDREDAIRIAIYAEKNKENLMLWEQRRPVVKELMYLSALRSRLQGISIIVNNPLREHSRFLDRELSDKIKGLCARSDHAIKSELFAIDMAIKVLINGDERLRRLMKIITSVKCVGPVTAVEIILATNEFRGIRCPKKFACYAGIAPFKSESGNITRRARVSGIANKRTKSLLHICAVNAIKFDSDLKAYYARKTGMDGKPKMLVLNAVRYKLVLRIFACLKQDRLYEQNYNRSADKQQRDL
jgi:transposase